MSTKVFGERISHFCWIYLVSNLRWCIESFDKVLPHIIIKIREHIHHRKIDGDILVSIIRHELYAADAAEETLDVLFSYSLPLLKSASASCEGCDIKSMLSNCGLSLSHMAVEGINIFLYFGNNTTE